METKKITKFTEYVKASSIWSTAKDYEDKGNKAGFVRGYNVEVVTNTGKTDWMSCSFIYDEPEKYFLGEYFSELLDFLGFTLTGRICFRGYGIEKYDSIERDTFVDIIEL